MKKYYLFLLMTLLSLASWADDITVNLVNLQYEYGAALPNEVTVDMFSVQGALPEGVSKQNIAEALDFNYLDGDDVNVGNHHYSLTTKANYNVEGPLAGHTIYLFGGGNDGLIKIVAKPIQVDWFERDGALTFNYSEQTQAFKLAEGAPEGVTFTVSNNTETNAGNYTATITGTGNYGGEVNVDFAIAQKPIAPTITVGELTFGNAVLNPVVTVADGQTAITGEGAFGVAFYSDATCEGDPVEVKNAGTYYVKVTLAADGNYVLDEGEDGIQEFSVGKLDIANCTTMPSLLSAMTYTGAQLTKAGLLKLYYPETAVGNDIAQAANYNVSYGENINVGENGGSVTFTAKDNGNLTGTKTVYFDIVAASVEGGELPDGLVFADLYDEDPTYTSAQITPETTGKVTFGDAALVEGTDYTVAYGDNINAGVGENGGSVTYTFIKNFTGSYKKYFNIAGAPLTIKADNVNANYGTAVPAFTVTYDGFVGEESEETEGIFGENVLTFGVKATDNAEAPNVDTYATVGTYYIWPAGLAAANYDIDFASGVLTVGAAPLRIVADDVEKYYGDADADVLTYTVLDATNNEVNVEFPDMEGYTAPVLERGEGADGENVGEYLIVASGAAHPNYTFTYEPGTLKINPRPVAIKTSNQQKDYGVAISQNVGYWSTNPYPTPGGYFAPEEGKADLGVILYVADGEGNEVTDYQTLAVGGEYTIMAKLAEGSNYALITEGEGTTCVWGTLTVNDVTDETVLALDDSKNDNLTKINAFDGKDVNVTIKFSERDANEFYGYGKWKAGYWTTLVLPFDISVADLSKAFGYAIVNVIDPTKTVKNGNSSEFYGKLTMKGGNGGNGVLAANKPILIKIAGDLATLEDPEVEGDEFVIDFGEQRIVAPEGEVDLTVNAGEGTKFVGTYEAKAIGKDTDFNHGDIWFMLGDYAKWAFINAGSTTASWTIVPFAAYIDMSAAPVEAMTFYFEEIDGTVTAISSVDADIIDVKQGAEGWYTLNGVKLDSAPTQKGIYIFNGKKVAIQ